MLKLRYVLALAFIAGLLGLSTAAITATATSALADATHQAVIGMPFTGKWAYNVNVNPPYTDQNSSYPAVHAKYYGDWATDVYATAGTAVRFEVSYATGSLSYSWISVTNGSCGQRTVIDVKVNGVDVGSVYYEHMANAVKSGPITNGMIVGYVHDWGGCNPGPHVHIEMKNATNYSCWVDNGHPGVTLNQGDDLGVLGSTNTAERQACTSVPSGSGGSGGSTSVTALTSQVTSDGIQHVYSGTSSGALHETYWGPGINGDVTDTLANF